ncbi:carbohydrate ABC transporter permease [Bartonella sp. HY328]|uniref:carbohydrate ABC transporter permease n=1 Tax=unclassified Bartonella TaxID=2645622 RepID=UPI003965B30C
MSETSISAPYTPTMPNIAKLRAKREEKLAFTLMAPALILALLLIILPVLAIAILSFTDFELGYPNFAFTGFNNYIELFNDKNFRISLQNTIKYVLIVTPASLILGLLSALAINSLNKGKAFFRTVYFLPVASLIVAMATVWQYLFHPTVGPINGFLAIFGIAGPNWLGSANSALGSLAIIGIWQTIGFNMVLFLAGLTAIPKDLYDAAEIDGVRSRFDKFRLVTWPLLGPTTIFVLTISIINSVKVFETVKTLTEGGPNKSTEVLLWTIYQEGFIYLRVGYASAMTMVFIAILLVMMLLQHRFVEKRVHYQ